MTQSESIITVSHLTKRFGNKVAVSDLSFSIEKGSITGLLGPNGAGKTTTIQMLLDLITPSGGSITIFGKNLHKNREAILERMNFSSAYISLPLNLTVKENLLTFARLYCVPNPKKRIQELTHYLECDSLLPLMTYALSSGQMTRVNLVKALLNKPELLLLDEPTASLDPDIADKTRMLLRTIRKTFGITILYTSHNMAEVEEMCDRVIFIKNGIVLDDGSPQDLIRKYEQKDLHEVFLAIARK